MKKEKIKELLNFLCTLYLTEQKVGRLLPINWIYGESKLSMNKVKRNLNYLIKIKLVSEPRKDSFVLSRGIEGVRIK